MAVTGPRNIAYAPPVAFAMAYFGLGDDRAFEWFDRKSLRPPSKCKCAPCRQSHSAAGGDASGFPYLRQLAID